MASKKRSKKFQQPAPFLQQPKFMLHLFEIILRKKYLVAVIAFFAAVISFTIQNNFILIPIEKILLIAFFAFIWTITVDIWAVYYGIPVKGVKK